MTSERTKRLTRRSALERSTPRPKDLTMYQHGDFIFSQIGAPANAISAVTEGYRGARVNHVGVVVVNDQGTFVLEAFPPEVRVTQIDVFVRRSQHEGGAPRILLARLVPAYGDLIGPAIAYGIQQRNLPYDQLYLTGENALYCSELLVDMFRAANGGEAFFAERPMSFRDLVTGELHPAWVAYYDRFGMGVPEDEPGSNPGDISKDPRLVVVHVDDAISGYVAP